MLKTLFKSPTALFYALIVHAVLIGVLVFSMDWSALKDDKEKVNIVEATVIDEKKILKQIEDLKKKEARKIRKEEQRQRRLKKQAVDAKKARKKEENRLADVKKKRVLETKKSQEQKKQRILEEKRLAVVKKKRIVEQKQQQELKKKRKKEEKRLADARRKQQIREEETARKKQQARQRKIAELEKRLKEEENQQRLVDMAAEQKDRDRQITEDEKRQAVEREKQAMSIVRKYKELIRQKVGYYWRQPSISTKGNLKSTVRVRLIPGGDVVLVETTKSSGDKLFDRSVEIAVHKAAPLPLPSEPGMFERFRDITFLFDPNET